MQRGPGPRSKRCGVYRPDKDMQRSEVAFEETVTGARSQGEKMAQYHVNEITPQRYEGRETAERCGCDAMRCDAEQSEMQHVVREKCCCWS